MAAASVESLSKHDGDDENASENLTSPLFSYFSIIPDCVTCKMRSNYPRSNWVWPANQVL